MKEHPTVAELKKKVYIAGALTNVQENANRTKLYEYIANVCNQLGFNVYVPHLSKQLLPPSTVKRLTPERIFDWDTQRVTESDIVVAYVGLASLGVGIELGYAALLEIPLITICERGQQVSPMVLGHRCLVRHIEYDTERDIEPKLQEALLDLQNGKGDFFPVLAAEKHI